MPVTGSKVAAERSEKVNAVLLSELKLMQIELDTLRGFVNKSLRQRGILWKAKSVSALALKISTF